MAVNIYCYTGQEENSDRVVVCKVGQKYVQYDWNTYKVFECVLLPLDQDEEVNDNGLLLVQDEILTSCSNSTRLHSNDHTHCNGSTLLSVYCIFSAILTCILSSVSTNISGDSSSHTQRKFIFKILQLVIPLLLIFSTKVLVSDNSVQPNLSNCTTSDIRSQTIPIELTPTSPGSLEQKDCFNQEFIKFIGRPSSQATSVTRFPIAHSSTGLRKKSVDDPKTAVGKVCPMRRLLHQLHTHVTDVVTTRKRTSCMYSVVALYSSNTKSCEVKLDNNTRQCDTAQRSLKKLPRIAYTRWISCFIIVSILLLMIPCLYPIFCRHKVHSPRAETEPESSHATIYPSNPMAGYPSSYVSASAVRLSEATFVCFNASNMAVSIDDGAVFSQAFDVSVSEEAVNETHTSEVHARLSSDAGNVNLSELVGIGVELPITTSTNRQEEDAEYAPVDISEPIHAYPDHGNVTSGADVFYSKSSFKGFSSLQEF